MRDRFEVKKINEKTFGLYILMASSLARAKHSLTVTMHERLF